jgi:hypothetical protein
MDAWRMAIDPAWVGRAEPIRLAGGVLVVGVGSASLRQELAQFHAARLLGVLRAALPDVPLVGIRFSADAPAPAAPTSGADAGQGAADDAGDGAST